VNVIAYTELLNYTGSEDSIDVFFIISSLALLHGA